MPKAKKSAARPPRNPMQRKQQPVSQQGGATSPVASPASVDDLLPLLADAIDRLTSEVKQLRDTLAEAAGLWQVNGFYDCNHGNFRASLSRKESE